MAGLLVGYAVERQSQANVDQTERSSPDGGSMSSAHLELYETIDELRVSLPSSSVSCSTKPERFIADSCQDEAEPTETPESTRIDPTFACDTDLSKSVTESTTDERTTWFRLRIALEGQHRMGVPQEAF